MSPAHKLKLTVWYRLILLCVLGVFSNSYADYDLRSTSLGKDLCRDDSNSHYYYNMADLGNIYLRYNYTTPNSSIGAYRVVDGSFFINISIGHISSHTGDCPEEFDTEVWPHTYTWDASDHVPSAGVEWDGAKCSQFNADGSKVLLTQGTSCYNGCSVQSDLTGFTIFETNKVATNHVFNGSTCQSDPANDVAVIDDGGIDVPCYEIGSTTKLCDFEVFEPPLEQPPSQTSEPLQCFRDYATDGTLKSEHCTDNEDEVCWYDNGTMYCDQVASESYSCIGINGEIACHKYEYDTVSVLSPDSVDHPANGGNADGDTSNDTYDPDASGNVPGGGYGYGAGGSITQDNPTASDRLLADDIVTGISDAFDQSIGTNYDPSSDQQEIDSLDDFMFDGEGNFIDQAAQVAGDISNLEGGNTLDFAGADNDIISTVEGLYSPYENTTCDPFTFNIPFSSVDDQTFTLTCDMTQPIRDFLFYLFYVVLVIGLYYQIRGLAGVH